MSNISDAFDAIKTLVETTLPDHKQLTNPYDIGENTTDSLLQGWGLALNAGLNTQRELSCRLSLQRTISIPIARARHGSSLDTLKKETNEKLLLEDQFLIVKALEKDPTVNDNATITRFVFTGDGGIETVYADSDAYIVLISNFELEYFENLE